MVLSLGDALVKKKKSHGCALSKLESTRNSQLGIEMLARGRYFLFLKC